MTWSLFPDPRLASPRGRRSCALTPPNGFFLFPLKKKNPSSKMYGKSASYRALITLGLYCDKCPPSVATFSSTKENFHPVACFCDTKQISFRCELSWKSHFKPNDKIVFPIQHPGREKEPDFEGGQSETYFTIFLLFSLDHTGFIHM